jgi:hypothetical protein
VTPTAAHVSLAALALAAAGCGGLGEARVVKVAVFPTPAGPGPVVAAPTLTRGVDVLLSAIESDVPHTLSANPPQTCKFGPTVRITLAGGRMLVYGPCERPPEIERLRLALLRAAGLHARPGPASSHEWKAVLMDWYDGRIDDWHRCAAVYAAIRHLPMDTPIYSTVRDDLKAYAKAVC